MILPSTFTGVRILFGDQIRTVGVAASTMAGAVVSSTVTTWVAVPILPAASLAVHVTVVGPNGNVIGASLASHTTPTASVAVAVPMATGVCVPVASAVTFAGATTTGRVVSTTATVNVDGAEVFPAASRAAQVTVVVPIAKVDPETGAHVSDATATLSVAVGSW